MKIAVIGLGYWGPNLVRNFLAHKDIKTVVCFDQQESRLEKTRRKFHGVETAASFEEILKRSDIDGVAVATPVSTHFQLGMEVLKAGKHLLLEKPMTTTTKDAETLVTFAEKQGLKILVDHTFLYTGSVRKIKQLIDENVVGDILYFDSVRVNLGLFQHDTNVIWDLAPHDISIMHYLVGKKPSKVNAIGARHLNGYDDMAYITVQYNEKLIAHFHVNWLSPVKIRRILIGGTKHMVVYDDMQTSEKVRVYDKGVEIKNEEMIHDALVQYRIGDMFAPRIDEKEALSLLADDFVAAIRGEREPLSNGVFGTEVVRVLEATDISLKNGGMYVSL